MLKLMAAQKKRKKINKQVGGVPLSSTLITFASTLAQLHKS